MQALPAVGAAAVVGGASSARLAPVAGLLAWLAIVAVGTTILLVPYTFGQPNVFDEGFMATGGMLILRGWLPIRDFYVIYGPGQYYFTAAVYAIFGEDLYFTRFAHQIVLACLGCGVVATAWLLAARSWFAMGLVACAFTLVARVVQWSPGYAALPATLALVLACLAFARWGATRRQGWLLASALLVGLAGAVRWDFGLFGVAALCLALPLTLRDRPLAERLRAAVFAAGTALALIALAFAPFVALGGAARWWDEVPRFMLWEFGVWRNLDFVASAWADATRALQHADFATLVRAGCKLAFAALPPLAALAALLIAGRRLWRPRSGAPGAADAGALMLGFVALFLFNQMRVRSGWPQGFPSFVAALPLAAYALAALPVRRRSNARFAPALRAAALLAFIAPPVVVAYNDRRGEAPDVRSAIHWSDAMPRATRTRLAPELAPTAQWADYVALVRHVRQHTAPGEPIFSGVADTSRLFVNDAMLYFLADRPPATRWVEMEPGLANTERGQRELVLALERQRVRTVVLFNKLSDEPNATARSNGIHLLDDYLRERFVAVREFGAYVVMARRAP